MASTDIGPVSVTQAITTVPRPRRSFGETVSMAFAPLGGAVRSLVSMRFRRSSYRVFSFAGSHVDYLSKVGDGTSSSTVAAPLLWVARTFPEAPPALWQELDNGQEERVRDHPMLRLMRKPNDYYTGVILWMATTTDWMVDGNAYWLKIRDQDGIVRELWWVPHWLICPKGDESNFVTHYEYRPNGQPQNLPVDDVIHFRFGLDTDNPLEGASPLKSVLREVFTDDEAAAFTASLLRNMGVPGLVVSPKAGVSIDVPSAEATKSDVENKFSGDNRGRAVVMTGATDIAQFGFSPEQLLLKELRRIPEERVTAVLGIPAIVAGLGAGLDRSTFTNMAEAREAAYEAGIIPMQRILAETILFHLLSEFEPDPFVWRFGFDLSKVRVLQEDLYRQVQRYDLGIRGGWVMVSEGRRGLGLEVSAADDVYIRQLNTETVKASDSGQPKMLPGLSDTNSLIERLSEQVTRRDEQVESELLQLRFAVTDRPHEHHFHMDAGAIQTTVEAPLPTHVTVEAPPPAEVHVTPQITATLDVPKRTLVMRRDNGAETTYEEE